MAKSTTISVRLSPQTEALLQQCRERGHFPTATDAVTAGLKLLARELHHQAIREEIARMGVDSTEADAAMIDWETWAKAWAQGDHGEQ